jgi:hypothetical protein
MWGLKNSSWSVPSCLHCGLLSGRRKWVLRFDVGSWGDCYPAEGSLTPTSSWARVGDGLCYWRNRNLDCVGRMMASMVPTFRSR